MAVIQSGAGSTTLTVDPSSNAARFGLYDPSGAQSAKVDSDGNIRVNDRCPAFGALGCYNKAVGTGAIIATSSAGAVLFTLRWTDGTRLCLIERIRVGAAVAATITTSVYFQLNLYMSRSYTVSPTTNITPGTFSGNNAKRRTSMGTSLLNSAGAGLWTDTTAAAGITGFTKTDDTDPIAAIGGATGTAVGTQFFGPNPANLWDDNVNSHPLILAANEGITITAPFAGPATGTYIVLFSIDWMEVAAY
jgi:hypothetical protein